MRDDPWASGVLDKEVHARLVADIDNFAAMAGIQRKWITSRLSDTCGPAEMAWVTKFKFHADEATAGLCFVGRDDDVCVPDRMAAICGALTRNFVFANVVHVNTLVENIREENPPNVDCLLVPNFFVEKARGGYQADWRSSLLLEWLLDRHARGGQTVLYVSSTELLAKEYGAMFARLIQRAYTCVDVA